MIAVKQMRLKLMSQRTGLYFTILNMHVVYWDQTGVRDFFALICIYPIDVVHNILHNLQELFDVLRSCKESSVDWPQVGCILAEKLSGYAEEKQRENVHEWLLLALIKLA